MKEMVVVSRKWKNPEITAFVSQEQVGAKMDLQAFLGTLVEGIGNPTFYVTKAQLMAKMCDVSEQIIQEMKQSTRNV